MRDLCNCSVIYYRTIARRRENVLVCNPLAGFWSQIPLIFLFSFVAAFRIEFFPSWKQSVCSTFCDRRSCVLDNTQICVCMCEESHWKKKSRASGGDCVQKRLVKLTRCLWILAIVLQLIWIIIIN